MLRRRGAAGLVALLGGAGAAAASAWQTCSEDEHHGELHLLQHRASRRHAAPCGARALPVCGGKQYELCVYDEACEEGMAGCSAGGFLKCRFCGFAHHARCYAHHVRQTLLRTPGDVIRALQGGLREEEPEMCGSRHYFVDPSVFTRQSSGRRVTKDVALPNGTTVELADADFISGHVAVFNGSSNGEIGAFLTPASGMSVLLNNLCCSQGGTDTPETIFSRCWCSMVAGVGEPARWASGDQSTRQVLVLRGSPTGLAAASTSHAATNVMRSTWANLLAAMPDTFDFVLKDRLPDGMSISDFCGPEMKVSAAVISELEQHTWGCTIKEGGFMELWEKHRADFEAYGISCNEGTNATSSFEAQAQCERCEGPEHFDAAAFVARMAARQGQGVRWPLCEDVATVRTYVIYVYGATPIFYGNGDNPSGPEYLRVPTDFRNTLISGLADGSYAAMTVFWQRCARTDTSELTGRSTNEATCGKYVYEELVPGFTNPRIAALAH